MNISLSPNVEVWDENGDPVYYDDLEDLKSQLGKMSDCKMLPIIQFINFKPVIVQLKISKENPK